MPCESRVVIIRDRERRITRIDLVCDGACSGGRCRKIEADERPATDDELQRYGITPKEDHTYRTFVEKCACVDSEGRPHAEAGELQRCCHATLRCFIELLPPEKPKPGGFAITLAIIIKKVIICEKREGQDCAQCTCERFKVAGPAQELVDENGEVTGTAESVICRCL